MKELSTPLPFKCEFLKMWVFVHFHSFDKAENFHSWQTIQTKPNQKIAETLNLSFCHSQKTALEQEESFENKVSLKNCFCTGVWLKSAEIEKGNFFIVEKKSTFIFHRNFPSFLLLFCTVKSDVIILFFCDCRPHSVCIEVSSSNT